MCEQDLMTEHATINKEQLQLLEQLKAKEKESMMWTAVSNNTMNNANEKSSIPSQDSIKASGSNHCTTIRTLSVGDKVKYDKVTGGISPWDHKWTMVKIGAV